MEWLRRRVIENQAVQMIEQAFIDMGLVGPGELKTMTADELMERVRDLGQAMADMPPNELQQFVNGKIDGIPGKGREGERRRRLARNFLQKGIKEFSGSKK